MLDQVLCAVLEDLLGLCRQRAIRPRRMDLAITYADGARAAAHATLPHSSSLDPDWLAAMRITLNRAHTRRVSLTGIELRTELSQPAHETDDLLESNRHHRAANLYRTVDAVRGKHGGGSLRCASALHRESADGKGPRHRAGGSGPRDPLT